MTIAIIAEGIKASATGGDVTTDAANTTGADLIVLALIYYHAGTVSVPTVLDSKGNTWTALTDRRSSNQGCRLFYCAGPTVGTGHTFSTSGANFPTLAYIAVSGASATPYHSEAGNATESGTSLQPGSVTPPADGCLVVTGLNFGGGSGASIGSGFTAQVSNYNPGVAIAGAIARLIQGTAAAVNPTWNWTGTGEGAAGIAVFQPAVVGPTAGTAALVPAALAVSAAAATGGTAPYTYQWQRNAGGGSYSNLSNGGGVSGATTLDLTDGSAVAGTLYGYRLVVTDSSATPATATSNAVTAQVYTGGAIGPVGVLLVGVG
jgi:hypothetical protein